MQGGSLECYKAQLVAKGFHQLANLDYGQTYNPVVKPTTIQVVLPLAYSTGWAMRQIDIQNAFLHGTLFEEVYMTQPSGFSHLLYPFHVCRLNKAIYSLEQAPRAWFSRLSSCLLQLGFHASKADSSLFIFHARSTTIFILIYVDDIIVTSLVLTTIDELLALLQNDFAVKDLGDVNFFLSIELQRLPEGLLLSLLQYILDLLRTTKMLEAKPISSPMASSHSPSAYDSDPFPDTTLFRSTIGSPQYLSLTRPNLAFAVNRVCQFMHRPTKLHWQAVKCILRYLKHTLSHRLLITKSLTQHLEAFFDADWVGCLDGCRSTSAYCIFLGKKLISWSSRKHPTVS
ncbi:hypothetical protein F2P56_002554 [Juglans regia]|uniref:Reverse transcriptase Ty1/copia-type domain-containing protein n=1 Tax=Juglans regia TaxID=51240 RepID=A0A834D4Z5_JUGRE|nr:hypothetical protein F2P56_002554 [Juglans regia]